MEYCYMIFMQFYAMKLREFAKIAEKTVIPPPQHPAFRCSRRVITSLHNVTSYRSHGNRGKWLLLCEVNTTFFNFLLRYIMGLFLQRKCGDYEIMQASQGNLCGESGRI